MSKARTTFVHQYKFDYYTIINNQGAKIDVFPKNINNSYNSNNITNINNKLNRNKPKKKILYTVSYLFPEEKGCGRTPTMGWLLGNESSAPSAQWHP